MQSGTLLEPRCRASAIVPCRPALARNIPSPSSVAEISPPQARITRERLRAAVRRIGRAAGRVLGPGRAAPGLDDAADAGQGHQLPARRLPHPLVRRRRAQRQRQLPRPPPGHARRQDRADLRARRPDPAGAAHQLPRAARARVPARQRAARARRAQGRPRHDLPADDSRGRGGDARLRAHRRDPLGGVRRLRARTRSPTASPTAPAS